MSTTGVFIRRNLGTDTRVSGEDRPIGIVPHEGGGRAWRDAPTSPGRSVAPRARKRHGRVLHVGVSEEALRTLDFSLPSCAMTQFWLFSASWVGVLVTAAPGT